MTLQQLINQLLEFGEHGQDGAPIENMEVTFATTKTHNMDFKEIYLSRNGIVIEVGHAHG